MCMISKYSEKMCITRDIHMENSEGYGGVFFENTLRV